MIEFDLTINIPLIVMLAGILASSVRQSTRFQVIIEYLKAGQSENKGRINKHDKRLADHDRRLDRHESRLDQLDKKVPDNE
ncbi:hypothetical protein GZ77_26160 [Endozoicomonas montiporae]|uniref:Uncharacterized protein n=1 Tax=Endozoicomonas montiporae TaxID=1027273 RepID=A0A081MYH9_9GAMM|nr:hypothetical protein [Endozoicomonas montiporae]KEQ11252.1 hypothetical protein GZ77_26515 [Endozoicomonas montiporae]KEQ11296.1 hypothetical protein GZ77_26160 [Endozoicomonas montiporae]